MKCNKTVTFPSFQSLDRVGYMTDFAYAYIFKLSSVQLVTCSTAPMYDIQVSNQPCFLRQLATFPTLAKISKMRPKMLKRDKI